MDGEEKGTPIKVKFSDKRARRDEDAPGVTSSTGSPLRSTPEETADTAGSSSVSRPTRTVPPSAEASSNDAGMSSHAENPPSSTEGMSPDAEEGQASGSEVQEGPNYLEDLRRVQAEFDNYRKRMLREQTQLAQRASARLVERMLPVLDNFESAIEHGEGGTGVELVYKELRRVLEEEGLEEIAAEGHPFDPRVHEAFDAVEDENVSEPTVRSVLRRGYRLKDQVLRPSMVGVARPPEQPKQEGEAGSDQEAQPNAAAEDVADASSTDEPDAAEG